MNKHERVVAAIKGEEVDGLPSSFSLHFPPEAAVGPEAVEAHLRFFEDTDTDILKVMNEHLLRQYDMVYTPSEYNAAVVKLTSDTSYIEKQVEMTKQILDRAEKDAFTQGTLHGIVATAIHVIGHMGEHYPWMAERQMLTDFCRWDEPAMADAFERIADYMCELARAYVQDAGVDSVYYAALGGETRWFTDDEFARLVEPGDRKIMKAVKDAGGYCFLHVCKDTLNMERYRPYAAEADVMNWGVYEVPFSLEQGRELWPGKTLMGGLENRSGAIASGDAEQARQAVRDLVADFGRTGLIVGADCTLATEQDRSVVRAVVEEARSL